MIWQKDAGRLHVTKPTSQHIIRVNTTCSERSYFPSRNSHHFWKLVEIEELHWKKSLPNELSPSQLRLVNLSPRYCRAFLATKATPNLITSILQSAFNTLCELRASYGPWSISTGQFGSRLHCIKAFNPPQKKYQKKTEPFPCAYGAKNSWSRILESGLTLIFSHHLNQKLPSNSQVKPRPRVTNLNSSSTWR